MRTEKDSEKSDHKPLCFDGSTYDEKRDGGRLRAQHQRVLDLMKDGAWRPLSVIALFTGDPEASVSARLRDLRKTKFGGHSVDRRYVTQGLWEYRVVLADRELFR